MWFLNQLTPGSPVYSHTGAARLLGRIDYSFFQRAHDEIIRRHQILRTTFLEIRGRPMRVVGPPKPVNFRRIDLSHLSAAEQECELKDLLLNHSRTTFDLLRGPLFHTTLVRLRDTEHVFAVTMHHIITDGWSVGVFMREAIVLHANLRPGPTTELPNLPIQVGDYARRQRQWLEGDAFREQLEYWKRQLRDAPTLEMPTDYVRPLQQTFHGATCEFDIAQELYAGVKLVASQENTTPFAGLLACFYVLLLRYTGIDDLSVGVPFANRHLPELADLIGLFVNTLVLRVRLSPKDTFRAFVRKVRDATLETHAHQNLPFERLVDALQPLRDLSRNPLFQIMLALENMPSPKLEFAGLQVVPLKIDNRTSKFDLTLLLEPRDAGLHGSWEYNTDLYRADTIERFTAHYLHLLHQLPADPDRLISAVSLLSDEERRTVLYEWNDTAHAIPAASLPELFAAQAADRPDAIAVVFEDTQLSYGELEARANQLAHYLRALGVGPEVIVGLCLERSLEMIIGLLAILKAGGAYLPLDPDYPRERLSFMLADARAPVLITQSALLDQLAAHGVCIVELDTNWPAVARQPTTVPRNDLHPYNTAYIIYTSGSTGTPKGVAVSHSGIPNLAAVEIDRFTITPTARMLQFASPSFDATIWEIGACFAAGARLILMADERAGETLGNLIRAQGVTHATLPPAVLTDLPADLPLQTLIVAGEVCSTALVERWWMGRRMINAYGPTETTVCATTSEPLMGGSIPPIGRPIWNTRAYVLDGGLQPVPAGVAGELYIAGYGLARAICIDRG